MNLKTLKPRFGLKYLILVVSISAIALGYWTGRARIAAQMTRRHNDVAACLQRNLQSTPSGTVLATVEPSIERSALGFSPPSWRPSDDVGHAHVNEWGHIAGLINAERLLDLPPRAPKLGGASRLANGILSHYSQGLSAAGLQQQISEANETGATQLWTAKGMDLSVWIEVRIENGDATARVRVLFLDTQQMTIWSLWRD
jgi:hypothetical protein